MQAGGVAELAAYRDAVADLLLDVAGQAGPADAAKAESVLVERTGEPEIRTVLDAAPGGAGEAVGRLLGEVRRFRPSARGSAGDLAALVRIWLLSQVDLVWWGHLPAYRADTDVRTAPDLVALEPLRRRGALAFRYRQQSDNPLTRAARAAQRRAWPDRAPRTAGLRFACARPAAVSLLNELATELATRTGGVPLWVNSIARSEAHQHRLRGLGYTALLPSAHCVGYAADVEMSWLRRFDAYGVLAGLLLERHRAGELNVIDEGQAWHVCLSPAAVAALPDEPTGPAGG